MNDDHDIQVGPDREDGPQPMAVAMEWVYRVLGVVVVMVGPGLLGQWLDRRWGTVFLALTGFALGLTLAISALLTMTKTPPRRRRP